MPAIHSPFPDSDFGPFDSIEPVFFRPPPTTESTFTGTSGNDTFTGTNAADTFDLSQGGNDTASGLGGNDTFTMGAALNAADKLDGGTGNDVVQLDGDYSAGLTLKATTIVNVEQITLFAGFSYKLVTNDANVAAGATLTVKAQTLGASDTFIFNGSAETDGNFAITAGDGNDTITGGAGSDIINGGAGNDTIYASLGHNDQVNGGAGNDEILLGGTLTATSVIAGGPGTDKLILNGDYSTTLVFNATTMTGVETLQLDAGHNYNLTTDDATVASGQTLTVNATQLTSANSLTFNGGAETNGFFHIMGGGGDDFIFMGGAMVAGDRIDGGGFSFVGNQISLDGDYTGAHALTFAASTITSIQEIVLSGGHSYTLTTNDANVASGQHLQVDATNLNLNDVLTFNGAAETDGSFEVDGGGGNDIITGGAGGDTIYLAAGGDDTANGGGGDDNFFMGGALTAADRIDGGAGNDTVELSGEYTGVSALTLAANTIANVETLKFDAGSNYTITMNDGDVAGGNGLFVDGRALHYGNVLNFNGSAETDGFFVISGGAGNDFLIGGAGNDNIAGNGGADELEGGAGNNTFVFDAVSDSTGPFFDTIVDFQAGTDILAVPFAPTAVVGTVVTGSLSLATFDSDLAAAMNSTTLPVDQAALFVPSGGDFAGETFLIVDENGNAGYQAGQDLVIHLLHAGSIGTLTTANFETTVT
jgi:Ca2+-binding RTX toxin-like protein